ncbi:MAG: DUF4340 domain-containing protein [Clostridia bacterium]|nr:DUF4340 domain-containing protein [Clostridia bacterium]
MKKKIYSLTGAAVILAALIVLYFVMASVNSENDIEDTNQDIAISDLGTQIIKADSVKSFSITNENGSFVFNKKGDNWRVEGYDNSFNSSVIDSMASVFTSLYAEQTIEENAQDMSKYNLDKPAAQAKSGDITINAGMITADGKYYYVSLNDEKTVYMVNSARIAALTYGFNDIIDKSVAKIDSDTIQELSITYRDKSDILVKYDKDNPIAREYAEKNGLATLVMEKPVENMLVYPYNLQGSVLQNLSSVNIKDLIEIKPADLSKYGLSEPVCTIYIADSENSIKITAGDVVKDSQETLIYVMVNDRPEVFTMEYRALKPFLNASIADFVEKFVSLYQRSNVNKITIEGDTDYTIDFRAEGENDFRDIDGVKKDYRNTYINNTLVDKERFTDFYELLVGIGFDNIVDNADVSGEPGVTITFELSDGSSDTAMYYDYDESFYIVSKGDNTSMLVSKQTVRRVLNEAQNLCK